MHLHFRESWAHIKRNRLLKEKEAKEVAQQLPKTLEAIRKTTTPMIAIIYS